MRFSFCGFHRESGEPRNGHVEAADADAAYQVLSDHEIVTESLREDEKPDVSMTAIPDFEEALNSALDLSSSQVPFDALSQRYRGKKVWVIDREKIREQVAQIVDSTLAATEAEPGSGGTARERVADAINGLFHDPRNLASQHDAQTIAKMREMIEAAAAAKGSAGMTDAKLAEQIGRLSGVVEQAESLIAAMQTALRNVESGGSVPRRRLATAGAPSISLEQSGVLREIFESNLHLRRSIARGAAAAAKQLVH